MNDRNTVLKIVGDRFLINDELVYSEIENCQYKGLLMNARFIQGVFDDQADVGRFNRFGRSFNPGQNTEDLVQALPEWYAKGLRAITVGFQGGGPCFTTDNKTVTNHPYKQVEGRMVIDEAYANRMLRILEEADAIGMVVIISCFYPGQVKNFKSAKEIMGSLRAVCNLINDSGHKNVMVEICNEYNLCGDHPLIGTNEGMASLILLAQEWLDGDVPVGSSLTGGCVSEEVANVSDVVLVHGNGCSPQDYQAMIQKIKGAAEGKPILCNEDSQCIGNMITSMELGVGWGYYNNMTKQEPPTLWGITEGEDQFFADRMAITLGMEELVLSFEDKTAVDKYFLQGMKEQKHQSDRYLRLASLYPETIDKVVFLRNDEVLYTAYNEPFAVNQRHNWLQLGTESAFGDQFTANVILVDGRVHSLLAVDHIQS